MNRYQLYALGGILMAATTLSACATAPADKQAQFDRACAWANGAVPIAQSLIPVVEAKLGHDAALATSSLLKVVNTTCSQPLDITNPDVIIQRVYDAAGQVIETVLQAQKT